MCPSALDKLALASGGGGHKPSDRNQLVPNNPIPL